MDVRFITTLRDLIDTVPISDGQVIVSKDNNDLFYDMYQTRYRVGAPIWEGINKPNFFIEEPTTSIFEFAYMQPNSRENVIHLGTVGEVIDNRVMPRPTFEGLTFIGWYTNDMFEGDIVTELPETYPVGRTKYYARWSNNEV